MMHDRKWRRKKSAASDVPPTSPPDVLAQVFRGEAINGMVPTLEARVKAAIAAAPYHSPKFRRVHSIEQVLEAEEDRNVAVAEPTTQIKVAGVVEPRWDEMETDEAKPRHPLRRADPFRVYLSGPNVSPDDIGNRPHEFLARVARGEPIDGYLPPLKLRRIAAAASAPYYAASLRSVHFQEEVEEVKEFVWTEKMIRMVDAVIDGSYRNPDFHPPE